MRVELKLHPDSVCDAVDSIEVYVSDHGGAHPPLFELRYVAHGRIAGVRLMPEPSPHGTELWRHTCFEAFVRLENDDAYDEYNFAPDGRFTVFSFLKYRVGAAVSMFEGVPPESAFSDARYELSNRLHSDQGPRDKILHLGLSAVIEETNGRLSYWALRHPPGKPDFHHPDCFALELPPPSTA